MSNIASVVQVKPNLVQAEFFLPEGSLSLKKTVRFFDRQNDLTLVALRTELLESKKSYYLHRFGYACGWLEKKWFGFMCANTDKRLIKLAELKIDLACRALLDASELGAFAVEQNYRRFRPVQLSEIPDVLKVVENIRGVWLFVFAPNELCADKNVSIASAM